MFLFQRVLLLGFLGLSFLLGVAEEAYASDGEETLPSASCEAAFLGHSQLLQKFQEIILKELLLGPEVTFSNDILQEVTHAQIETSQDRNLHQYYSAQQSTEAFEQVRMLLPHYPEEALQEVQRFIGGVFEVESIEVHSMASGKALLEIDDGVSIHVPSALLVLRIRNHSRKWVALSLEPGCVEVNFSPQKLSEVRSVWTPIFDRAHALGFTGYTGLASGGGGGHMHVGFEGRNIFESSASYLKEFLLVPLWFSGMRTSLAAVNDYGEGSNLITPMDRDPSNLTAFLRFLKDWEKLFGSFRRNETLIHHVRALVAAAGLSDHFSYVSMKNFFAGSPRLEMRFIRAYQSIEDLMAISHMVYAMVLRASMNELNLQNFTKEMFPRAGDLSIQHGKLLFSNYLEALRNVGLPRKYAQRLLRFGGEDMSYSLDITGQGRDLRGRVSGWWEFDSKERVAAHTIRLRLDQSEVERVHVVRIAGGGEKSVRLMKEEHSSIEITTGIGAENLFYQHAVELSLLDQDEVVLSRYLLIYTPKVEHPYDASDFRVVLMPVTDEQERRFKNQEAQQKAAYHTWMYVKDVSEPSDPFSFRVWGEGIEPVGGLFGEEAEWTETALFYVVRIPQKYFEKLNLPPGEAASFEVLDKEGKPILRGAVIANATPEK